MFEGFEVFFRDAYLAIFPKRFLIAIVLLLAYAILLRLKFSNKILLRLAKIRDRDFLFVLIVLAILMRVMWCFASPTIFARSYSDMGTSFAKNYSNALTCRGESALMNIYAVQISQAGVPLDEDGALSTRRSIGYPYLLGGLYKLFGYHDVIFKVVQILLSAALIPLAFVLAFRIFGTRGNAWIAAFLSAFYPLNICSVNIILDEFPFLVTWLFLFSDAADNINRRSIGHTLRMAVLLGLCTAFRTHALFLPVIFFLNYLLYRISWRRALIQMIFCVAVIFAVSGFWAYNTYKTYGKPLFFQPTAIWLYATLNDRAYWHNGYLPKNTAEGGVPEIFLERNPVRQSDAARRMAFQWVCRNPLKTLKLVLMRNAYLLGFQVDDMILALNEDYSPSKDSFARRQIHLLRKWASHSYSMIAILALLGVSLLIFSRRDFFYSRYPAFSLVLSFFIYWFVLHGLYYGLRKYRWPWDLFLLFPAAFFLNWLRIKSTDSPLGRQFTER